MRHSLAIIPLLVVALADGCVEYRDVEHDMAEWSAVVDIQSAPPPLRTAAAAIVRIQLPSGATGTGFFVSDDGRMVTNNHVLGIDVCAREGCQVKLDFDYQRGSTARADQRVFVKPLALSVGYDLAYLQVMAVDAQGAPLDNLFTPSFLTIAPRDARGLVGSTVHVIGHPVGGLKKWARGTVLDDAGTWFWTDAPTLPGNSGSPVLDDEGRVVGLLHRGTNQPGSITRRGYNFASICTGSDAIAGALAPGSTAQQSAESDSIAVDAATTETNVVEHVDVYLGAARQEALIQPPASDGTTPAVPTPEPTRRRILDLLAAACDRGLAETSFSSVEDMTLSTTPCRDAVSFLGCKADPEDSLKPHCPDVTEKAAWIARFDRALARELAGNGDADLFWLTRARAAMEAVPEEGEAIARTALAAHAAGRRLDLELAGQLARYGEVQFEGTNLLDYVRNYQRVTGWEFHVSSILTAVVWMTRRQQLTPNDLVEIMRRMWNSPQLSQSDYLQLESLLYELRALP